MRAKILNTFPIYSGCIAVIGVIMLSIAACGDDTCTELKTENLFTNPITYEGNETFKYLHHSDTHTFQFFNKQTYYSSPINEGGEGDCPTQYQGAKVSILNQTTGTQYLFQFERDQTLFPRKPVPDAVGYEYTYYKFSGTNCLYYKQISYSDKDSITILGKRYSYVSKIGGDTLNNYIYYSTIGAGIISIRINGETWDLIPE